MHKALGLSISAAAIIATGLVPAAAWAATTTNAAATSSTPAGGDPNTTVTFTVTSGALTMTAPASTNLGSGAPGTTVTGALGPVTVTDDRGLLTAAWTVTASSTSFTTGDLGYSPGSITTTGTIMVTGTPITLSNEAAPVVTGTDGVGNNTASWDPAIAVAIPAAAVSGTYVGTITQSVS
jgi:hypothetical protein